MTTKKRTTTNGAPVNSETASKEASQATETAAPELTVQDLQNLRSIIDVASQRGAFKPNEMVTVGNTYNRLDSFLSAIAAANAQKEETVKE